MEQIINILAGWFWSILCLLAPLIFVDLVFLNGRLTRRLGQGFQTLLIALIELPFRLIGALFRGFWRGLRGNRGNNNQGGRNQGGQQRIVVDINVNQGPPPPPNP